MGELLLQEDILSKVLVHLVDSGLHECRRVCRKWYEVCNKLPVKLSLYEDIGLHDLQHKFPNAVSLNLSDISWTSASAKDYLLPCLSELNRITHLDLCIEEWRFVQFQPSCLATFHSMRSLSLTILNESAFVGFLKTLRCMTSLTALELSTGCANIIVDMAPITEIKELRELRMGALFLNNEKNQFTFGTQTQLTKLEVLGDGSVSFFPGVTLQVSNIYAPFPILQAVFSCSRFIHTPQICAP